MRVQIAVYVGMELATKLEKEARKRNITVGTYVRLLLEETMR